jgi:Ni/Co efflux regulator RcnB
MLALAAALALAIPAARADPHDHGHGEGRGGGPRGGYERGGGGGPHGGYERGPEGGPRGGYERAPHADYEHGARGAYDASPGRGPAPRWERRDEERDEGERWDDRRFNGYWLGSRWYFGEPPGQLFREPGFRPGFAPWRRGAYLPPSYQGFVVDEYWRYHLRRPPFGYHWVQVGDDFLLVSVSSGVIFDIIPGE